MEVWKYGTIIELKERLSKSYIKTVFTKICHKIKCRFIDSEQYQEWMLDWLSRNNNTENKKETKTNDQATNQDQGSTEHPN